jgi:hypothetical protein
MQTSSGMAGKLADWSRTCAKAMISNAASVRPATIDMDQRRIAGVADGLTSSWWSTV